MSTPVDSHGTIIKNGNGLASDGYIFTLVQWKEGCQKSQNVLYCTK